jgi:hypothetical protein
MSSDDLKLPVAFEFMKTAVNTDNSSMRGCCVDPARYVAPFCKLNLAQPLFASLLEPFFDKALLHNPMAGEGLISVIPCEAISMLDPTKDLRPLYCHTLYLAMPLSLSNSILLLAQ